MPDDAKSRQAPYPQYRCPVCEKDLPLDNARLTVTCAEHLSANTLGFSVREARPADQRAIEDICDRAIGETEIDVFGATFDVLEGINLIAEADSGLIGLLSLAVSGGELNVVLLSVYPEYQGQGVGSALMRAAYDVARERRLPSVRVVVSNDDIPGLDFYQRQGFVLVEIAVGVLADALGAAVGGFSGIPVRDEIRMRRSVA